MGAAHGLSLHEAISSLEDPRVERHKRHKLPDIIILTMCAVISGGGRLGRH
ncbi:MAG: transposase family protein [Methylobacter sp.]